ncbi:hypothetical protein SLINC_5835 [Streptomyces lincolnensis]|uniref:Uncharacterized protein n=1 Tax=Streptomyces lincolnensis TaxID=1915 RepID=A0A1B1MHH4_STRLN|nr:hypothetical protein [Streptomyces lincolnensis]ANS68059.1 hypothetical protein SLINC_5835 [Streptomyces lincolnensis]AXG53735.1 hypothetical protein SLCG_2580 [Streptomyces lincolnensis]QMV09710.1 hypothetical protein GJU35_31365 [Streptomyces lincolnensis]
MRRAGTDLEAENAAVGTELETENAAVGPDLSTGNAATGTAGQGPVHREFGTGLLRTEVTGTPEKGYVWVRHPGPRAPRPFTAHDPRLTAALPGDLPPGPVRWAPGVPPPEADGPQGRRYAVRGPESVAGRLLHHGPDEDLAVTLHGVGRLLRALHDTPVPAEAAVRLTTRPRGIHRFTEWLAGRSPSPRAAYAESLLRPRLGEVRMAALHALCARITGDREARVLCHGAPALGSLVPAVGPGARVGEADLLIGEDLCLAPWYHDLGWTLGELVELRWYRGDAHPAWPALLDAFFTGYGRDLGDDWHRLAALRVLLHLHDYTAYVGWDEKTFDKYTGFAMFLLDLSPGPTRRSADPVREPGDAAS